MTITISELRIHPVKGFKRTMLQTMDVIKTGPLNDRRFLLIDENNQFISQRTHPLMATIDVQVQGDKFTLLVPGQAPLIFQATEKEEDYVFATIWKDTVRVVEQSHQASQILSNYLEIPCRLMGMVQNNHRMLPPKYSPTGTDEVLFSDGFPFLLISQASLDDLNSRLDAPVPMDRFRPNIVISGCAPFEEDEWKVIQIGEIIFDLAKACSRCIVTTVDQETGIKESEKGKNPLKALARYRNSEKGILFGQNMIHRSIGVLTLGQAVTVLERKEQ